MEADQSADVSRQVIGVARQVLRRLGPGLPEQTYEDHLCQALDQAGIRFVQQQKLLLPDRSRDPRQVEIIVGEDLIVEVTAAGHREGAGESQLHTYISIGPSPRRLLLNFSAVRPTEAAAMPRPQ